MRSDLRAFVVLSALLAASASAQPADADRLGLYAVVGSAAPAQSLFRGPADPVLTLGYRVSDAVHVQLGARLDTDRVQIGGDLPGIRREVPDPIDADVESRTRALAGSAGVTMPLGRAEVRTQVSLGVDVLDRTVTSYTYGAGPDAPVGVPKTTETAEASSTYLHAGVSSLVTLPIQRKGGRLALGVGLAVLMTERMRGTIGTPPASGMAFLSVPASLEAGPVRLTVDARAGIARRLEEGDALSERWSPVTAISARVEI
ncbi:hypothetical protein [Rubrivirga marina]|uniref:Outer membrane protein beta-barrel domain-containing protein n=1 Tax=Rubrivirga marina TaxID=1196024 RepID=A0A271J629_9BACT|nr:hypothetical protein [Rubrivirga marina]PAP78405.1 hypothetical protein BSZ37_19240 [Rubrivirga marina]